MFHFFCFEVSFLALLAFFLDFDPCLLCNGGSSECRKLSHTEYSRRCKSLKFPRLASSRRPQGSSTKVNNFSFRRKHNNAVLGKEFDSIRYVAWMVWPPDLILTVDLYGGVNPRTHELLSVILQITTNDGNELMADLQIEAELD